MRSVASMIEELKKFPEDWLCYGYESTWGLNEGIGLGIESPDKKGSGFISCHPTKWREPRTEIHIPKPQVKKK